MRRADAFPSQFFSKDDVADRPVRLTIDDVRAETIAGERGEEDKPVMFFREKDVKRLILNNTNWITIEEAYGPDSDDWSGKPIELYLDSGIMFGNKRVGGVRVRIPAGVRTVPRVAPAGTPTNLLTWEDAIAHAATVGMSKEDLVAALKMIGATAYSPKRDTPLVRQIVADASQPPMNGADEHPEFDEPDESIPF